MYEFERLTTEDGIQGVTGEDLIALSRAIPWVLAAKDFLMEQPRYYYSRMPCFLLGFCYGGLARHFIGDLAQLWSQGVFRDDNNFFFGGTGGFSGCVLWGVELPAGNLLRLKATPEVTWRMSERIRSSGGEIKSVLRPSPGAEQADFCETLKVLKDDFELADIFALPEPVPKSCEGMKAGLSLKSLARAFPKRDDSEPERNRLPTSGSITHGVNQYGKPPDIMQRPVNMFEWNVAKVRSSVSISFPDLPATGVTWHECMYFARCLTEADTEYDYRLPAATELQFFDEEGSSAPPESDFQVVHEWCSQNHGKTSMPGMAYTPRTGMKPIYGRGALKGRVVQRVPWSVPSGYPAGVGFRLVRTEKEKAW